MLLQLQTQSALVGMFQKLVHWNLTNKIFQDGPCPKLAEYQLKNQKQIVIRPMILAPPLGYNSTQKIEQVRWHILDPASEQIHQNWAPSKTRCKVGKVLNFTIQNGDFLEISKN